LNHLPNNLIYLGASAFQGCGTGIELTSLPNGIEILYAYTFVNCQNVKISNFGSSSSSGSQLKSIGKGCFSNAGTGTIGPDVKEILINKSIEFIDNEAFLGYANNTLEAVYFAKPWEDGSSYGNTTYDMGFTNPNIHIGQLENT
jgi:hypothetical protein